MTPTDDIPTPAIEALATALCREVPHSGALHPVIDVDRAERVNARLTAAGWSVVRTDRLARAEAAVPDDPWVGDGWCYICGAWCPDHASSCAWLAAKGTP